MNNTKRIHRLFKCCEYQENYVQVHWTYIIPLMFADLDAGAVRLKTAKMFTLCAWYPCWICVNFYQFHSEPFKWASSVPNDTDFKIPPIKSTKENDNNDSSNIKQLREKMVIKIKKFLVVLFLPNSYVADFFSSVRSYHSWMLTKCALHMHTENRQQKIPTNVCCKENISRTSSITVDIISFTL